MGAARRSDAPTAWAERAAEALQRVATATEEGGQPAYAARLTAQGAAALLTAIGSRDEKNRQAAIRAAGSGGDTPAERYLRDELAWRL